MGGPEDQGFIAVIFLTTTLAVSALGILLVPNGILNKFGRFGCIAYFLITGFVISVIPVAGLPLIGYVGGVVGDVSMLLAVLLIWMVIRKCQLAVDGKEVLSREIRPITLPLALAAIVFYPMALGLGMVDPYSWGFQPLILFIVVAIYGAWLAQRNYFVAATMLAVCLVAYLARLQESDNLWDYLLDPILAISCWVWSIGWLIAKIKHRRARQTQ